MTELESPEAAELFAYNLHIAFDKIVTSFLTVTLESLHKGPEIRTTLDNARIKTAIVFLSIPVELIQVKGNIFFALIDYFHAEAAFPNVNKSVVVSSGAGECIVDAWKTYDFDESSPTLNALATQLQGIKQVNYQLFIVDLQKHIPFTRDLLRSELRQLFLSDPAWPVYYSDDGSFGKVIRQDLGELFSQYLPGHLDHLIVSNRSLSEIKNSGLGDICVTGDTHQSLSKWLINEAISPTLFITTRLTPQSLFDSIGRDIDVPFSFDDAAHAISNYLEILSCSREGHVFLTLGQGESPTGLFNRIFFAECFRIFLETQPVNCTFSQLYKAGKLNFSRYGIDLNRLQSELSEDQFATMKYCINLLISSNSGLYSFMFESLKGALFSEDQIKHILIQHENEIEDRVKVMADAIFINKYRGES